MTPIKRGNGKNLFIVFSHAQISWHHCTLSENDDNHSNDDMIFLHAKIQ